MSNQIDKFSFQDKELRVFGTDEKPMFLAKEVGEILGIKNNYEAENRIITNINSDSTIIDYILTFLFKAIQSLSKKEEVPKIKNEIICDATLMSVSYLKEVFSSLDLRKKLFNDGTDSAKIFISKL